MTQEERKCNEMSWRYRTWLLSGVWPAVYWIDLTKNGYDTGRERPNI